MAGSGCRVSIHVDGANATQSVDLALPRRACLGDMLPSILELVHPDHREVVTGARWRLHRIDGSSLDESLTLPDNQVRNGDVLWLSTDDVCEPVFADWDATRTVVRRQPAPGGIPRMLCVAASVVCAAIGGTALLWSTGSTGRTVLIGGALTCAALTAAVVNGRTHSEPLLCTTFSVISVVMAAVTGAAAVPGGPLAAHLLLASSAGLATTVVSLRLTGRGLVPLVSIATTALLCTAACAASVAWHLGGPASGSLLAAIALATMSSAPRLAIALTRIGPTPPDDDMHRPPDPIEDSEATRAHEVLTAMIAGASIAAAIAAVSAGYGSIGREFSLLAAAFDAAVGAALLLRTRTHIGTVRRAALAMSGFVALTAAFVILAAALRQHAHWFGALAAVAGTGFLIPLLRFTPGLAARRAAELAEYAALAAVIPLGCWIAGLFGLVRNLALT
ncbi:type VII secretion integral membrane protein EccD [Mycolicibacterium novocastrense]|nr:type VII secretion integral membrane protein EccD [Mycolicibacterium novocastrense]